MIRTYIKHSVHFPVEWIDISPPPPIWPNGYILLYSVTSLWLTRTPIRILTPCKSWFYCPFPPPHWWAGLTKSVCYTYNYQGSEYVCTPDMGKWLHFMNMYSVAFIRLRQIPIDQLAQKLGFTIPFNHYIHDQDLQQAFGRHTRGVNTYLPHHMAKWVHFIVFHYLSLAENKRLYSYLWANTYAPRHGEVATMNGVLLPLVR